MPSIHRSDMWAPAERNGPTYRQHADDMVAEVMTQLDHEMRGQPASMVREIMDITLDRRLPGIPVAEDVKRDVAARISVGAWTR